MIAKYVVYFIFVFTVIGLFSANVYAQKNGDVFMEIPEFKLTGSNGEVITNKDIRGKVVVLDFWATWCAPCIKSFPALMEVEESFSENENVKFLYVNTLESSSRDSVYILNFLKNKGIDTTVYFDTTSSLSDKLGVKTLPYKLILNKSGEIMFKDLGFYGEPEDLIRDLTEKINSLLNE